MLFLYGTLVIIKVSLPVVSQFYSCKPTGKVIGIQKVEHGEKYLVRYDECEFPEDSYQTGYDRDWYHGYEISKLHKEK
jgi:hypothetical protein